MKSAHNPMNLSHRSEKLPLVAAALLAAILAGVSIAKAAGPNWPQWRGPDSAGVSSETNLPTEWSAEKNILWKTPIPGRGHSSPIIWENRIFLTTAIEGEVIPGAAAPKHMVPGKGGVMEEFKHPDASGAEKKHTMKVFCLDRDTGKILWQRTAYEGQVFDDRHKASSYASATPVTDGKLVYAYFGTEGIYAYDFAGNLKWKATVGQISTLGMGTATSPVLHENLFIVQVDRGLGDDSMLFAFDKKTGKKAWEVSRKGNEVSWSTPLLVRAGARVELITTSNQFTIAYDPATGKELWRATGLDSNAIPSPVTGFGMVYVSAGYPKKAVQAIKLGGSGTVSGTPQVAWSYDKGTAYVPSPILYGDYLYLTTDRGLITCLDARTGKVQYEGGRPPAPALFTASLVAYDGKLLQINNDGDAYLIQAGPEHKVVGKNSLGEPVSSTPAIAQGRIFIRGANHLYAIGNGGNAAKAGM